MSVAAAFLATLTPVSLSAQSAPPGWTTQRASGATVYVPANLGPGEVFSVTVYPVGELSGSGVSAWLTQAMTNDPLRPGTAVGVPKIEREDGKSAIGSRIYRHASGGQVAAIYSATTADGKRVHETRVVFSMTGDLMRRYKEEVSAINLSVVERAKRDGAGRTGGTPTVDRNGIRRGGEIVEGLYVGAKVYRKDDAGKGPPEIQSRYRLHLYKNGEFLLCDENDKPVRWGDGEYKYDPASGKIDLGRLFDLYNSPTDPDEDFCLYGRDGQGKPFIYAEDQRGFGAYVTALVYQGPTKRPSPKAEEGAKARAEAEARRYKWVTAPGKGVKSSQIEAVVHYYKVDTYTTGNGIGTQVADQAFLLLNDGSVHRGLPVPPDQLDVTLSKKKEPQAWGRWRRQGGGYVVAWSSKPGSYVALPGKRVIPGTAGTRLQGRWGTASASSDMLGGSYRYWGVTFGKDGRFVKDERGGASTKQIVQPDLPATQTTYDDEGSVTSTTGNGVVLVSKSTRRVPNGHRQGRYEIDGYTMTLRYDNGVVVRIPFFTNGADHKWVWFEGAWMDRDEK